MRKLAHDQERIACSVYGRLELHAALHRKMRENSLAEHQLDVVLRQFRADEEARLWTWLPLTAAIMTEVAATFTSLSGDVFLRTGDAIHLLTARQNRLEEVFSNDQRLPSCLTEKSTRSRAVAASKDPHERGGGKGG